MYCLELKGECNKSMNICRGMMNTNLRTREGQVREAEEEEDTGSFKCTFLISSAS